MAPGLDWIRKRTLSQLSSSSTGESTACPSWLKQLFEQVGLQCEGYRLTYAAEVLAPLLSPLLLQVLVSLPNDPAIFLLECILTHLGSKVPRRVRESFDDWRNEVLDQQASETEKPKSQSSKARSDKSQAQKRSTSFSSVLPKIAPEEVSIAIPPILRNAKSEADAGLSSSSSESEKPPIGGQKARSSTDEGSVVAPPSPTFLVPHSPPPTSPRAAGIRRASASTSSKASVPTLEPSSPNLSRRRVSIAAPDRREKEDVLSKADTLLRGEAWRLRFQRFGNKSSTQENLQIQAELPLTQVKQTLAGVSFFSGCSENELEALAKVCKVCQFQPDQEVMAWGQNEGDMHIVHSGACTVFALQPTLSMHPGDCFGEELLLSKTAVSQRQIKAASSSTESVLTVCVTRETLEGLGLLRCLRQQKRKVANAVVQRVKRHGTPPSSSAETEDYDEDADLEDITDGSLSMSLKKSWRTRQAERTSTEMQLTKTEDELILIMDAVRETAQLRDVLQLDESNVRLLAESMNSIEVSRGIKLCEEGEVLEAFFVVREGVFQLQDASGKTVGKLRAGDCFGDMGLLYGTSSPHAIVALTKVSLWKLDHEGLEHVRRAKASSRIASYNGLLQKVPLFQDLSQKQLNRLADALEEICFVRREEVITTGSRVRRLYLIAQGTLEVGSRSGNAEKQILDTGQYFGLEDMILRRKSLQTVKVTSDTATLLTIDQASLQVIASKQLKDYAEKLEEEESEGPPPSASCSFTPGRVEIKPIIPRERLKRLGVLGKGSFGLVTLEEDQETHRMYALKSISKGYCVQQGCQQSVLQEKSTHLLLDSPFIIRLYATYKDSQFLYFLMDVAFGGELFEIYAEKEDWYGNATFARFYTAGAALGLDHMHAKKVIYRDLKLENILLNAKGYPQLSDFGLAKQVVGKTYTVCGTPDYMAPEILRRTGHNRGVDWWSLGIMLFLTTSGQSPFDAPEPAQIYRNVVRGLRSEHFPKTMSSDLVDVVKGLCRKQPEERLPMGPKGLQHLQDSPWFQSLDWASMLKQTLPAPWTPEAKPTSALSQDAEMPAMAVYEDDGSGWDDDF